MKRAVIAIVIVSLTAAGAFALGIGRQGIGVGKLGAASGAGPAAIPPVGCGNGTIDFSTGCAQAIPGGI